MALIRDLLLTGSRALSRDHFRWRAFRNLDRGRADRRVEAMHRVGAVGPSHEVGSCSCLDALYLTDDAAALVAPARTSCPGGQISD